MLGRPCKSEPTSSVGLRHNGCGTCLQAKQTRTSFPESESRAELPMELLHTDLMGPLKPSGIRGEKYVMTLFDDATGYAAVVCLKTKSSVAAALQSHLIHLQTLSGHPAQKLRSDRGTEYCNEHLADWLEGERIIHELTMTHTPQQNGRAERLNRSLLERVRALLLDGKMNQSFWPQAFECACYLRNRTLLTRTTRFPLEHFTGQEPSFYHLRVFGCPCTYAVVDKKEAKRNKLGPRSLPGRFVGYARGSKGYVVWAKGRFIETADCIFDERATPDTTDEPQLPPFTGSELVDDTPQPDAVVEDPQAEPQPEPALLPVPDASHGPLFDNPLRPRWYGVDPENFELGSEDSDESDTPFLPRLGSLPLHDVDGNAPAANAPQASAPGGGDIVNS